MSPLVQALKRLGRKASVPVGDVRAMFRDVLGGDQVIEGLVSKGFAELVSGELVITEAGKRRLGDG